MVSEPLLNQLGASLIQLIDSVLVSTSEPAASQTLLRSLLEMFRMDQAALFSKTGKDDSGFEALMAIDRTGKILQSGAEILSSSTVLEKSLLAMEPLHIRVASHDEETPKSIKDGAIRQIVCLPLTRTPGTVIFLGSRGLQNERGFSPEEMAQYKTAARASWLAIRQFRTQENLKKTATELKSLKEMRKSLIYTDSAMSTLIDEVERIAPFNVSLLIQGESGSGKEVIARFVHEKSGRTGPFVAVNCANLSETLLESELFGYKKGAFTGAVVNKDGLFKAADGGTLFLDELAELPFNLQAKILRALQERKVRPVGSTEDVSVDVRIVSATHQDLEKRITQGEFRSDLYYRIQEFTVRVPALRERSVDLDILAEHFITQASQEMNLPRRTLSDEARALLQTYSWPGNIRELKNVCRTAVIIARTESIQPADFRFSGAKRSVVIEAPIKPAPLNEVSAISAAPLVMPPITAAAEVPPLRELTRVYERQIIRQLLADGKSQIEVAARLDVSVRTLQRILSDSVVPAIEGEASV